VLSSDARFGLSPLTLAAVVRITTGPAYTNPSTIEEAFKFCDYLLNQPHCQVVVPGDRHREIFKRLCVETNTRGPRATDAWFAALAIE
jgi:predicted nucleic acid-binding protein